MKIFKKNIKLVLAFILIYGIVLRFYNLNWGAPFFFHPDERNIASSVSQLLFPQNLNPHFFAYGTFPIYVNYFTGVLSNFFSLKFISLFSVSFGQAIIIGRFYSAVFSVLCIFLIHKIFTLITKRSSSLLIIVLTTSVGFIQFAHFATFEMWLTLFSLLLFYFIILYYKNKTNTNLILIAISLGLLISIKISSIVFLPITICIILFIELETNKNNKKNFLKISKNIILIILVSSLCYIATSPYSIIANTSFISSMNYESGVALGTLPVFYTGGFYNTIPGVFQLAFILPFLLNPFVTIILLPTLIFFFYKTFKTRNFYYFLILIFFFAQFLSQVFLFAKWTRYMVPFLPFAYLVEFITVNYLIDISQKAEKIKRAYLSLLLILTAVISFIYSFAFFTTVFLKPDSRIEALNFAKQNIPSNSKVLSEVYDLGIVPFNSTFPNITLFNFYDLDSFPNKQVELSEILNTVDYIILPSQRILQARITNPDKFPVGNNFYANILSNKRNYKLVYTTPCDILCKIIYMGDPIFNTEVTANVFDKPTVFIYKKLR